jgi:hypothetical protein
MNSIMRASAAALCAAALALPAVAAAQGSDQWQFGAQIYGYFPSLSGSSNFPASSGTPAVNVNVDGFLDNLDFAFMGSLEARKGRWGAFTDLLYLDVGSNKSGSRDITIGGSEIPAGASASVNYNLKALVWTLAGEYTTYSTPTATMDVLFGARMADLEQDIDWGIDGSIAGIPTGGRTGTSNASRTQWDAIVGVKGRWYFSPDRQWFVPYYADIGAGDSDLTWQVMGGVGYSWKSVDVVGAWRYLKYDLGAGRPFEDLSLNGPSLSVVFRW